MVQDRPRCQILSTREIYYPEEVSGKGTATVETAAAASKQERKKEAREARESLSIGMGF